VAYIIKGSGAAVAEPMSALAKSQDFGRQRDVYVLATKYRNLDMQRLWSDFQAEQPAIARLIVKDSLWSRWRRRDSADLPEQAQGIPVNPFFDEPAIDDMAEQLPVHVDRLASGRGALQLPAVDSAQ
jgi:hypothetical protein